MAAYGTTRAMYDAYDGALYQLLRISDNGVKDVTPLQAGGVADVTIQDSFCANTTCQISIIYDQSPNGNHLTREECPCSGSQGPLAGNVDYLASAIGAPVTLNGQRAYGVFISEGTGYRNDETTGVATGNDPEGMYGVFDGTHYNENCCFDFGNAETNNRAGADGAMEAVYFGSSTYYGHGAGNGPWVMADLENGLYPGGSEATNNNNPSQSSRFVTGFVKGDSSNLYAIRGGDATSDSVGTYYSGPRPDGYYPMQKQGAVVLGTGGDNGNLDVGTFYEGVITSGYPSDETENAVQANIAAAGYAVTSLASGPPVEIGSTVTLRVTTPGFDTRYLAHSDSKVNTQVITSSSTSALQQSGSWIVHQAMNGVDEGCVSFESVDTPGSYIRHYAFELYVNAPDGSQQFTDDATWCPETSFNAMGTNAVRSWSYPLRYFRHYNDVGYAAGDGGPNDFDTMSSFTNDASWAFGAGFI